MNADKVSLGSEAASNPHLQVIACGLPRTGTTTTGRALSILLDGPVLDGVADTFLHGTLSQQNDMITLSTLPRDSPQLLPLLHKMVSSKPYVATTDTPFPSYLAELQTLYPRVKFVLMVRPFSPWYDSFTKLQRSYTVLAPYAFLWPRLKRCLTFMDSWWENRMQDIYPVGTIPPGKPLLKAPVLDREVAQKLWDAHVDYVRKVVPEENLLTYDVRDGWGPLCEFLGKDVPEDVKFPHEFSGQSVEEAKNRLLRRFRAQFWGILVGIGAVIAGSVMLGRQYL